MLSRIKKVIINYWISEETNIFRNYKDAIAGFVVLVVIPAGSICLTISAGSEGRIFWNYTFPLVSIAMAGLYDSFGRYDGNPVTRPKLVIRGILDLLAIFFSAVGIGEENGIVPYISPILLLICGLILTFEMYNRIKKAILISSWNS